MNAAGWHRPPGKNAGQETEKSGGSAAESAKLTAVPSTGTTGMPTGCQFFMPELMSINLESARPCARAAQGVPTSSSQQDWPGWAESMEDWPGWHVRSVTPFSASSGLRDGLRGDEYLYAPPPPAPVVAGKDASAVIPTMIDFPDEMRGHGVGLLFLQGHAMSSPPAAAYPSQASMASPPQSAGLTKVLQRDSDALEKMLRTSPVLLRDAQTRTSSLDHHTTITVEACVPDGVCGGVRVAIVHEGRKYTFMVPDGVRPGGTFTVSLQNEGDTTACSKVEITVPVGAQPGDLVRFEYYGHEYDVIVPDGTSAGMQFMADVSPPSRSFAKQEDSSQMTADPLLANDGRPELLNDPLALHTDSCAQDQGISGSDAVPNADTHEHAPALPPGPRTPPKSPLCDWLTKDANGNALRTTEALTTHAQRPCPQRRAPSAVGPPQTGGNKDLSFGVGIQFEYDASSTNLCMPVKSRFVCSGLNNTPLVLTCLDQVFTMSPQD